MSDQAEADRGDGRAEHAARGGMQRRGRQHGREDRPCRIGERADADQRRPPLPATMPFGAGGVDQRAAGHLADQGHQARDRQARGRCRPASIAGSSDRPRRRGRSRSARRRRKKRTSRGRAAARRSRGDFGGSVRCTRSSDGTAAGPLSGRRPAELAAGRFACCARGSPSTIGRLALLVFRRGLTWSRVSSRTMPLCALPAAGTKCSAFQSTAILRLPTPRKPPKSMIAARGGPRHRR